MRANPVFLTLCLTLLSLSGSSIDLRGVNKCSEMQPASPELQITTLQVSPNATGGLVAAPSPLQDQSESDQDHRVDYARDIRPLLASKCGSCHGADVGSREAGLRLDTREGATAALTDGARAVVPGDPEASLLMHRVATTDSALQMPPPDSYAALTRDEVEMLRQWIFQGAHFQSHWAFETPQPVATPTVPIRKNPDDSPWAKNPIDLFVLQKLTQHGLRPNGSADRARLLRRVSLDLTGLPPDPDQMEQLLANWSDSTYDRFVDSLLASAAYGERMATLWLAAARYSDTNGYQHDNGREMWPWRDWVVRAFNRNMPYNQFVIEQLAGDLLPNPEVEQLIATGFNRNHGLNFEGGSIDAESQCDYVVDRTNTFGTVFLGLTLGCAQCHDHKTDPITQTDYYSFFAFFNTIDERGFAGDKGNAQPLITLENPDRDRRLKELSVQLEQLQQQRQQMLTSVDSQQADWERQVLSGDLTLDALPTGEILYVPLNDQPDGRETLEKSFFTNPSGAPTDNQALVPAPQFEWVPGREGNTVHFDGSLTCDLGNVADFDSNQAFSYGAWVKASQTQAAPILGRAMFHGFDLVWEHDTIRANLVHRWDNNAIFVRSGARLTPQQWYHLMVTYDGTSQAAGVQIYVDGKAVEQTVSKDCLTSSIKTKGPLLIGGRNDQPGAKFQGCIQDVRIYPRELTPVEVAQLAGSVDVTQAISISTNQRDATQRQYIREYFLLHNQPDYLTIRGDLSQVRRELSQEQNRRLTTMVMREMDQPRVTRRLNRGRYDAPAEQVFPGVPKWCPPMPVGQAPSRLSLAQWLVSPEHPLTARVAVNRQWQIFFGRGIVATSDDFGIQGSLPTHPELLDWLAREFQSTDWDLKQLHRLIVTSATYQQSAEATAQSIQVDPENQWLSRFPRRRLPAEMLRDQLLLASGLLDNTIGGPGVMPPQPEGLWDELSFKSGYSAQEYATSQAGDLFRRSVYTYWKRTYPPPNMILFDAAERSVCSVHCSTSNTPLQALVLLNDPCFVEPTVALAFRSVAQEKDDDHAIRYVFRHLLSREPEASELVVLRELHNQAMLTWPDNEALEFLRSAAPNVGIDFVTQDGRLSDPASHHETSRTCGLAAVVQVILSMNETLTVN